MATLLSDADLGLAPQATPGLLSDVDLGLAPTAFGGRSRVEGVKPATETPLIGRLAKDLAGFADMAASLPGGILGTAAAGFAGAGRDIAALARGDVSMSPERQREQAEAYQRTYHAVADPLSAPIARVMHAMGFPEDYSDADIGKAQAKLGSWIEQGSDWVEKHTGGAVTAPALQVMAQDLMNLAPFGFAKFVRGFRGSLPEGELRSGKISDASAKSALDRYTKETGNPEGLDLEGMRDRLAQSLTTKSDAEINAEARAYDLMTRGATKREVEAARKANPLVGKKLDEMVEQRRATRDSVLAEAAQADALKAQAEGAVELRRNPPPEPRARLPEAGVELEQRATGQLRPVEAPPAKPLEPNPSALERAAQKQSEGRTFDMTAEERVAWDKAPPRLQQLGRQSGQVDPKMLATALVVGGAAWAGAQLAGDEKLEGAILGGLTGAAASMLPRVAARTSDGWAKAARVGATTAGLAGGLALLDKDHPVEGAVLATLWGASHYLPRARVPQVGNMTIDQLVNARNGAIAALEREVSNVSNAMRTAVPSAERRMAVATAVERGSADGLDPYERQVYRAYRGFTKSFGSAAQDAGLLRDLVQNYVTHVVERDNLPRDRVGAVMDALFGGQEVVGGGSKANSRFAKTRKYATFEELEKALEGTGLRVQTRDIADLVDIYGRSMGRALENKKLFDALSVAKTEGGRPFIVPADKAPASYVPINTPQLIGKRVHPDLAPSVRFVAEAYEPSTVTRGLMGVSLATKRLATGLSLFHAQNLLNAYIGATGLHAAGQIPRMAARIGNDVDAALRLYREGGTGDVVDLGLRNGLKIERPMETDLEAGKKLGAAIDSMAERVLGPKLGVFERVLGGAEKLQRETFDRVTWDYLHSGLKLAVFTREFERGLLKHPDWAKERVAAEVASYVNDTFGGLDWYRIASETQSQLARQVAMSVFSPRGRAGLQLLMFAPDWSLSTFRAMYKALPGSVGTPLNSRLHQKYVLRTALMWATMLNGVNMATSGHPIWDNRDPTRIEYRDGTSQQVAKHATEGMEWLINPRQTALNKLNIPLSEVFEQLTGREYLSAKGNAPPIESRLGHLAGAFAPIPVQQGSVEGRSAGDAATGAALSSLGFPRYGMTRQEKDAARRERERKRRQKRYEGSRP